MKPKTQNLIFIITFLIIAIGIFILNIIVDPYQVNESIYKDLNIFSMSKDLYYTTINLSRNKKYDYVLISGSSGYMALSRELIKKKYGNMAFLSPGDSTSSEVYNLLKYFLKLHPETKNVIVSMDLLTYLNCYSEYTIPRKPSSTLSDVVKLWFSIDATKKSLGILSEKLKIMVFDFMEKKNDINDNKATELKELPILSYKELSDYKMKSVCEYTGIENLKKIDSLIQQHNLNAIYFIPPCHGYFLSSIYKNNQYSAVENYKREAAKITPFFDMGFINFYTSYPLKFLFFDIVHAQPHMLGVKVVESIFENKIDDQFVVYVTKDNVDDVLKMQRKNIINYYNQNKIQIEKYINLAEKDINLHSHMKDVYYKDLKEKFLQDLYNENVKYLN